MNPSSRSAPTGAPDPDGVRRDHSGKRGEQTRKSDVSGEAEPRMPHERDESHDSQASDEESMTRVGQQAHEDVEKGLVDTDRGPVTDRVYNDKVKR